MTIDVLPVDKKLTVGQLREYMKDLPDTAYICPQFVDPPNDDSPRVRLEGFGREYNPDDGSSFLLVFVDQIPLQGDCQCEKCRDCYPLVSEELTEYEPDEDELEDDSPKPVGVCPCGGLCYEY